ncbi:MAG: sugar-binding domain-containing protein [Thermoguttaceae bacterium]
MSKNLLFIFCLLLFVISLTSFVSAESWKPVEGKILSVFAKDVDPENVWPEYPRPQLVRENWLNLNGLWDYAIIGERDAEPKQYEGKILVPFAIESALSGVKKTVGPDNRLWYHRTFEVPKDWAGQNIRLNFEAVDWDTTVYLNGKEVGRHKGGYSPFAFDITDALSESGPQTLVVSVWDPTDARRGTQPRGKQIRNPNGIWYTSVTGIWQTVWIEPVAPTFITKIKGVPNLKDGNIAFEVQIEGAQAGDTVLVQRKDDNSKKEEKVGTGPIVLEVKDPILWTPNNPHLYDIKVQVLRDGKVLDSVDSYFGMRDIKLGKDENGVVRILLNGEFLFQHGPLDQGWWSDGLYTAPTDEALAFDIRRTKDFGFNMLRKHVKVEPRRFYTHCDRLGMLVWQDMPSGDRYIGPNVPDIRRTPQSDAQFRQELEEMILTLDNHPSIVMWVPFNEGWGQYETAGIADFCRELDPTRLVNSVSGWADRNVGDVHDIHVYPGPGIPPVSPNRALVLGEYGGLGMPIQGHTWQNDKNWGYQSFEEKEALFDRYLQLNNALHPLIAEGLSAAVYTQTTDVEVEVNGLMTYDRAVDKFDAAKMKEANLKLQSPGPKRVQVIQDARDTASIWKWRTEKPADDWMQSAFDDSGWKEGESGFGTEETPNTLIGTVWNTSDIWLRKTVDFPDDVVNHPEQLRLSLYHDEDCEVYMNGVLIFSATGYIPNYVSMELDVTKVKGAIKPGKNLIAVHCKQTGGGQYIDLGFSRLIPSE